MADTPSDNEEVVQIPGCVGYFVTKDGDVWSNVDGHFRKMRAHIEHGYPRLTLVINNAHQKKYVHELVLSAFSRPRRDGEVACHIDGARSNNRAENLRWGTYSDNISDARRHGTLVRGSLQWNSKFREDDIREMRALRARGDPVSNIASRFGAHPNYVRRIVNGRAWAHVN